MGSTTKTVTGTTNSAPWTAQQNYLTDGFSEAGNIYRATQSGELGQYYPNATYTPMSGSTQAGLNQMQNLGNYGNAQQNQAADNTSALLGSGAAALPGYNNLNFYAQGQGGVGTMGGYGALQGAANNGSGASGLQGFKGLNYYSQNPLSASGLEGGGTLSGFANGQYSGNNPHFQQMVQDSFNAARPSIDSAFAASGRLGSGNHDMAIADSANRAATQLGYQNYSDSLGRQLGAAGQLSQNQMGLQGQQIGASQALGGLDLSAMQQRLGAAGTLNNQTIAAQQQGIGAAGTLNQNALNAYGLGQAGAQQSQTAQLANAGALMQAGQAQEGYQNQALQDQINRWNYQQNLPLNNLANYMGMIQGNYGGTSTTTQPIQQNQFMQGLGGASGLLGALGQAGGRNGIAGLGSLFGSSAAGAGAAGASGAGGAAAGFGTAAEYAGPFLAALPAASDVRLKENISRVGLLDNGLPVYSYNYKGENKPQIGLMAQDVAQVKPHAVTDIGGGYLGVYYNEAVK
jgi:hypothetical protein